MNKGKSLYFVENLSKREKEILKSLIAVLEYRIWRTGGWSLINGGYAKVSVKSFNEDTVELEVEEGEYSESGRVSYVNYADVPRELLSNLNISMKDRIEKIKWS